MTFSPNIITITYKQDDYFVNVTANYETYMYEAWIWCESYGIMSYMFGVSIDRCTFEEMVKMVESDLPRYIEAYKREVIEHAF